MQVELVIQLLPLMHVREVGLAICQLLLEFFNLVLLFLDYHMLLLLYLDVEALRLGAVISHLLG